MSSYSLPHNKTPIFIKTTTCKVLLFYCVFKMFTVFKDETAVVENLQNLIETIANESINKREKFFVGFSGMFFNLLDLC